MNLRFFRHLVLLPLIPAATGTPLKLEVSAGDRPLRHGIVEAPLPEGTPPFSHLKTPEGSSIPAQTTRNGTVVFILPQLAANRKVVLEPDRTAEAEPVSRAIREESQVRFEVHGKPSFVYQMTARRNPRPGLNPRFLRGGYLHPVLTPSGATVTDDYPVDHLHHHGIWMAWTKTAYDGRQPDFWNMGQGKGKADFAAIDDVWSGSVEAGLTARHRYTDLTADPPVEVLDERWTIRSYALQQDVHAFDVEATQTLLDDKPLDLPVYHYGGLGVRGLEAWNGRENATFLSSENLTDRDKANGQPARWLRMSGNAAGGQAGIAILSHPENTHAPQPVRIHPKEPFISFAPQTRQPFSIRPGQTYRVKYRFIVSDGPADPQLLETLWQDYAHPAKAEWKP